MVIFGSFMKSEQTQCEDNPRENFLSKLIPTTWAIFFVYFPAPGHKIMVEFPGGGAKFSQTQRNCSILRIKLAKESYGIIEPWEHYHIPLMVDFC